jgi:hypothetical protein
MFVCSVLYSITFYPLSHACLRMVSLDLLMKKEVLFAVVIGLIVGLVITFGMYRAQQAMKGASTISTGDATPIPATSSNPISQTDAFPVSEPKDDSLVSDANIHITGQTFPNATVAVLGENTEVIGAADDKGNFSIPYTLQAGSNILTIRAMSDTHDTQEVIRSVVYSTADLSISASPVPTTEAKASPSPTAKGKATPTPKPKTTPTPSPKGVTP